MVHLNATLSHNDKILHVFLDRKTKTRVYIRSNYLL
jgi:hypothetical protein